MSDHDEHLTTQDVDPVDEWAEGKDLEYRLDAEQEAQHAAREQQDQAAEADDDETFRGCDGYSPDTWCGICEDCQEAQAEERDLYGPVG